MKVVSAEQMRRIDQIAQEEMGITSYELMEAAGRAIADITEQFYQPQKICVVCGKGNNAGDGFVVARAFYELGREIVVVILEDDPAFSGAALTALQKIQHTKIDFEKADALEASMERSDVVVDAILGTGLKGNPREPYAAAIETINRSGKPVVAADVPSGLRELLPGEEPGHIVKANVTATVGLAKSMLLTQPGASFAGVVKVLPINFPKALLQAEEWKLNWAAWPDIASWLPERKPDSNKGTYGHVGIIGSVLPYAGATVLTTRAALRAGCGLATIYTLPSANAIYKTAIPEATSVLLRSRSDTFFDKVSADAFAADCKQHTVLAVGPGMGTAPETRSFFEKVLQTWTGPMVIDADGLNLLADGLLPYIKNRADCILTPHPGEMSRLTGLSTAEVQADREKVVRDFTITHGVTVLLKGTGTLIARPDGQTWLVPGAEPALAKGGTGDVLTGAIASLFAQGMPMWQAGVAAATAHLEAGRRRAVRHGRRGVLASEVADEIPRVLDSMEDSPDL